MPGIPTIVSPKGRNVSVLDDDLLRNDCHFGTFPAATQKKAVVKLEKLLKEANADGSMPHLIDLQVLTPAQAAGLSVEDRYKLRHVLIDKCSWQLAQFLRYSKPTRIYEAVAPLTYIIDAHRRINGPGPVDVVPALYLGVALSRIPGEEERCIKAFTEAFDSVPVAGSKQITVAKNLLWARANLARLFRRIGRVSEAMEQEHEARSWIITHIFTYAPSVFKGVVEDDIGTGEHITDHGDVLEYFSQIEEIGPQQAFYRGTLIMYGNK